VSAPTPLLEISSATAADLDAIAALEASLQAFPWASGHFADSLAAGHRLRVGRCAGVLAGFSVAMQVLDEVHLLDIAVGRPWQGRGCGRQLLAGVVAEAAAAGARHVLLEVRRSNMQAIDFYTHHGFRQIGVRRAYYPAAIGREDALVFDKELT
jgi:ribosomal-protein-alanine N-acetyltransferase